MLFHVPIRLVFNLYFHPVETTSSINRAVFRVGGLWGLSPPLDQWNLLISGGFQAPTGPPWKEKKLSSPLDNFLNTPLSVNYLFEELLTLCYPRLWGVITFLILVPNWSGKGNIHLQTQIHAYNSSLCFKNKT